MTPSRITIPRLLLTLALLATPQAQAQTPHSDLVAHAASLEQRLAAVEKKLKYLTTGIDTEGRPWMKIAGANLRIVNGMGTTPTANGLGNLIVGYNELRQTSQWDCAEDDCANARTGSHNLIVGRGHNYTRYGGLVVGQWHTISGAWATVCGGGANVANGDYATVSGGTNNTASGGAAVVSGGDRNVAAAPASTVGGGGGVWAMESYIWAVGRIEEQP